MSYSHNSRSISLIGSRLFLLCVSVLFVTSGVHGQVASQVHLSLGEQPFEIVTTWSTSLPVQTPLARYGLSDAYPSNSKEVFGWQSEFVDNGTLRQTQYIHRVSFMVSPSVEKAALYYYQVWNDTDWSTLFSFRIPAVNPTSRYSLRGSDDTPSAVWYPKVTIYGDFGLINPQAFPALLQDLEENQADFIIHNGDFALRFV